MVSLSRWAAFAVALTCLGAAVACGSSDDSIPDAEDGGPGFGDGATGPDGQTNPDPTKDGSSPGTDGSQPTGPFCASQNPATQICEDWDDGTPPAQSTPQVDDGGSCEIDDAAFQSSPSSYKCFSPGKANGFKNALLGIATDAPNSAKKRTIGFAFQPDGALPTTGDLVIARTFVSNNRSITIELSSESGAVVREQSGGIDNHTPISAKPAVGAFTRYELAIDLDAKTAKLTANGTQVASLTLQGNDAGQTALNLGLQSSGAFTAHYDDVTIDWQ